MIENHTSSIVTVQNYLLLKLPFYGETKYDFATEGLS